MKKLLVIGLLCASTFSMVGCTIKDKVAEVMGVDTISDTLGLNVDSNNKIVSGDLDIKTIKTFTVEEDIHKSIEGVKAKYEADGKTVLIPECEFQNNMECETLIALSTKQTVTNLRFTCFPADVADITAYVNNNKADLINDSSVAESLDSKTVILLRAHVSEGIPTTAVYWTNKSNKTKAFALAYDGRDASDIEATK